MRLSCSHGFLVIDLVLAFFAGGGVLILLILCHQVIHVALSLSKLHLIHSLASVPMQEGLSLEHDRELLGDAAKHLLNGGGVPHEGGGHGQTRGRDVADAGLDVVRDPLHEVGGVLVLYVDHLLVHFLGAHLAAEHGGRRQVPAVAGIGGAHHVPGVPHLLGEFRDCEGPILLGAAGCEGREADHEEVEAREGDEVHGEFAEVGVQLPWEAETARYSAHCC